MRKPATLTLALLLTSAPIAAQQTLIEQLPTQPTSFVTFSDPLLTWGGAQTVAENFVVGAAGFEVEEVLFSGGYYNSNMPTTDAFTIAFYEELAGHPGTLLATFSGTQTSQNIVRVDTGIIMNPATAYPLNRYEYTFTLPASLSLPAGTYFVEVINDTLSSDMWGWESGILDPVNGVDGASFGTTYPAGAWNAVNNNTDFTLTVTGTDPGAFTISASVCPGLATVDISGATPGAVIYVASAISLGSYVVPTGPCAGTIVGLNNPEVRLILNADASGAASTTANIPAVACGLAHVVAFDLSACAASAILSL